MSLQPELRKILDRRTGAADPAPEQFRCETCQDEGAVFVRSRSKDGREELRIARCACDQAAGKGDLEPRYWDRKIPSIQDLDAPAQDVFPLSYGQRFQMDRAEAKAERDAIQAEQVEDE